jgi:hypothetical protein
MATTKTGRRNTAGKSGDPRRLSSVGRNADQPARKRPQLSMSGQRSGASKRSTLIDRAQASLPGGKSKSKPRGMWGAVTAALTRLGADDKRGGDRKPSKGMAGIAAGAGIGAAAMAQRRRAGKTPDAAISPAETTPKVDDGTETPAAASPPPLTP